MSVMETTTTPLPPSLPPPPLHFGSYPQKKNSKDASSSFSSYLIRPEDVGSTVDDSDQISVFDADNYFKESNDQQKENNKKVVVVASRLHNANHDGTTDQRCEFSTVSRLSSVSSADGYGRNYRSHSFHATPTASSEASWNSQTGLLSNPPGAVRVSLRNLNPPATVHSQKEELGGSNSSSKTSTATGSKWYFLGRNCPCTGKNSVRVLEEKHTEPQSPLPSNSYPTRQSPNSLRSADQISAEIQPPSKPPQLSIGAQEVLVEMPEKMVIPNFRRYSSESHVHLASNIPPRRHQVLGSFNDGTGFSFPILNQHSAKLVLKSAPINPPPLEDPPRHSLEVFQPRKSSARPASPVSRMSATDDDVGSDASSDLFEIESFSTLPTSSSYPMYGRRDSFDEATTFNYARRVANGGPMYGRRSLDEPRTPSVAGTECYEPSEASIDWSVTTAEGFDRSSFTNLSVSASDVGSFALMRHVKAGFGGGGGGGDGSKRRIANGPSLLSCRWDKAVSVGPHPVKFVQRPEGPTVPVGFGSTRHVSCDGTTISRPHHAFNKPSLPKSRSDGLSVGFAT